MVSFSRRDVVAALAGAAASDLIPGRADAAPDPSGDPAVRRIWAGVLDVAYRESGPPDGPPVILLHGFPYDVHAYGAVAPVLAKAGRRVIVPYLRGFGPTRFIEAATPRVGQQAALGNDLLALLDALGLRRATLAGFDWGARAACVVAALHPERVSGLVSSGGPGYNIQNRADFLKPRDTAFERRHWFYWYLNAQRGRTAFSNDPAGFCRYLWHEFSPSWAFDDATFARTAAAFENPDFVTVALHSYRFRIGEVPGDPALEPIEQRLSASPRITVPTIVLEGADEGVDPPEAPGTAAPHFTQLRRTTVLNGVGHNAPQEAPDLFAAAILDLDR
ncbi:alpha/beta fold hydrolase [Methylobacterium sp. A52T]